MGQIHSLSSKLVVIGNIGAPFGIKGWLKVFSYTDPQENILTFNKWHLIEFNNHSNNYNSNNDYDYNSHQYHNNEQNTDDFNQDLYTVLEIKRFNNQFLVLFDRIQDRNDAALLTNKKVAINRNELPELPDGQYYWADLIGSKVYNLTGAMLGLLDHVFTTGANDIMVVKKNNNNSNVNNTSKHNNKDYLIPYKKEEFVVDIDLINKKLIVNWDL
jgi:16S rRNA processing protein RimM